MRADCTPGFGEAPLWSGRVRRLAVGPLAATAHSDQNRLMSVVVAVNRESEGAALARWGLCFAEALERRLIVLCVERGDKPSRASQVEVLAGAEEGEQDPLVKEVCRALLKAAGEARFRKEGAAAQQAAESAKEPGEEEEAREEGSSKPAKEAKESAVEVRRLSHPDPLQGVLRELQDCDPRLLVVVGRNTEDGRPQGSVLAGGLFRRAPCATLLLRPGSGDRARCGRILVPVAGGPHSRQALRLASRCARRQEGSITALYVEPDTDEVSQEVGESLLRKAVKGADVAEGVEVKARVELGTDVTEAVGRVAGDGFDLVLVGASRRGAMRRALMGTVPDRLLTRGEGLALGVLRAAREKLSPLRRTVERMLDLRVPQLERKDRVELVEGLETGSRWTFDFLALIGLSTAIAALGLLQDSAAVVIGAMLVAPLMTPLLGAGLALIQGNLPLVRTASQAILLGFLTAVGISALTGLLVPLPALTDQLLARTEPTLLDLGVAFFSGVAAAYCVGRPNLSAALPGVAIAAALVPPIATIGIGLALGEGETARGAAILFGTNVVAIVLGAAAAFWGAGIRPSRRLSRGNRWARIGLAVLALVVIAMAVPLASFLVAKLSAVPPTAAGEELRGKLETRVEVQPGARLGKVILHRRAEPILVEVHLRAPQPPSPALARDLARIAAAHRGSPVRVEVKTSLEASAEAEAPPPLASPNGD